jgi:hypothetical protein
MKSGSASIYLSKFVKTQAAVTTPEVLTFPKTAIKPGVFVRLKPRPPPLTEPVVQSSKQPQTTTAHARPSTDHPMRGVSTAKPKFRRELRAPGRFDGKTQAAAVSQREIPIERCLRRLGSSSKAFADLADKLQLKLQHRRSLSVQFISDCSLPHRSHSELRMHHLKHVLDEPLGNFRTYDLTFLASQLSLSFKPNTAPARWHQYSNTLLASAKGLNRHGAKVTDTSYNLFLLKALQQILNLTGDVTAENYYDPHTKAITSVLAGKDVPVSVCCQAEVQVQLTELKGCRVVCTKLDCLSKTVTNFVLPLPIRQRLWRARPLVQAPMTSHQVSATIATGKYRSFSFRNASATHVRRRSHKGLASTQPSFVTEGESTDIIGRVKYPTPRRLFSGEVRSKLLDVPRRMSTVASNPLQQLLAKQRGMYSPAARLPHRGF